MTAAKLASILRDRQDRDGSEEIVDYAAQICSSQLASAISNVLAVATGAVVFERLWHWLVGHPFLAPAEAEHLFATFSPLHSGTVFYAALTGILLWLGSLAGGWVDNFSAYHDLPEAIAQHPLGHRLGRDRLARWGESVRANVSGWGTNVALGFLLGMTPALGRFLGMPLDVRHVTLNSGVVALAASSLGEGWQAHGPNS